MNGENAIKKGMEDFKKSVSDAACSINGATKGIREAIKNAMSGDKTIHIFNDGDADVHISGKSKIIDGDVHENLDGYNTCLLYTSTGVGEYLKSQNPNVKVVAVEPATSPVLSKGVAGPHKIQGIGAGFVPDTLNTKVYDEIIPVTNEDAFATGRALAREDGIDVYKRQIHTRSAYAITLTTLPLTR